MLDSISQAVCIASPPEEVVSNLALHLSSPHLKRTQVTTFRKVLATVFVRGVRMPAQCKFHTHYLLELLATFLALKHFHLVLTCQHVMIRPVVDSSGFLHTHAGMDPLASPVATVSLSATVLQCSSSVSHRPEPGSGPSLQEGLS